MHRGGLHYLDKAAESDVKLDKEHIQWFKAVLLSSAIIKKQNPIFLFHQTLV